jgi:hypothetical protein
MPLTQSNVQIMLKDIHKPPTEACLYYQVTTLLPHSQIQHVSTLGIILRDNNK